MSDGLKMRISVIQRTRTRLLDAFFGSQLRTVIQAQFDILERLNSHCMYKGLQTIASNKLYD